MWIPSKLTRPGRLHNSIIRPRVLDILEQAPCYKLILFRSPAGYGKTTMAAQWLNNKNHVGWFSLDEEDNELFRFINYFIRAINSATENSCPNSQTLAERRQYSSPTTLFSEVFSELKEFYSESYIVLDDYHLLHNEEIHEALRFFLKHMPDNLTLVVTSRSNPPLGTANLRVRDLMIEIDNDLLAFDVDETSRFFSQRIAGGIDELTAGNIRDYVEGWPSALQLIALQAQHQKRTVDQSIALANQFSQPHLWDYLVEEVFDLIDQDTRHFLMQCSVLESFNDTLVSEMTHRADALSMIESLERYGLFIYRLEGEQNWYRFHHLFTEFLAHERKARIPEEEDRLHSAAANAWLTLDNPYQALHHAQQANNDELTASLLIEFGEQMFNRGELRAMEKAINTLDDDHLYSNIRLPLLCAWLSQSQHRDNKVEDILQKALREMKQRKHTVTTDEMGQVNTLRAQIAINQNDPQLALELAELALSQLNRMDYSNRIIVTSIVAEVNHVQGDLDRALPLMQQTEKMALHHQVYHQALWALLQQSEILLAQGFVQAAFDTHQKAFRLIEEQKLQQVPLHEFLLRLHAQILWCWNRLDDAEECAYKGIDVLGKLDPSKHLHCYSMLARIAIGRGELDKAGKFIQQIELRIQQSSYHLDWTANASMSLLLYWQAKENVDAIHLWLEQATHPAEAKNHFLQLQWRNIARAQIYVRQFDAALQSLRFLQTEAEQAQLVTDTNRNLVVEAVLATYMQDESGALDKLTQAIKLMSQTGMIGNFLIDGEHIQPLLKKLLARNELNEMEKHRAEYLLKEISEKQRSRSTHFDEEFIYKLVNHPDIPQLVKASPLTQREWQVLGLIYSGFSNEQIGQELDVAATTIKTHIRNLYQKLNIANRKEAIKTAEGLLALKIF
jgi:LuxR family maltose regulon positive regulatory protein